MDYKINKNLTQIIRSYLLPTTHEIKILKDQLNIDLIDYTWNLKYLIDQK